MVDADTEDRELVLRLMKRLRLVLMEICQFVLYVAGEAPMMGT